MRVTRPPLLISLLLVLAGAALLLHNFLLLDVPALDPARWWPALLILAARPNPFLSRWRRPRALRPNLGDSSVSAKSSR